MGRMTKIIMIVQNIISLLLYRGYFKIVMRHLRTNYKCFRFKYSASRKYDFPDALI